MSPEEQTGRSEQEAPPQALPVLARPPAQALAPRWNALPARSGGTAIPVVQAAAVAAGSFVAGAAVAGLVHRRHRSSGTALARGGRSALHRRRRSPLAKGRAGKGTEVVQIVGSRSLLVDVHLLGLPASER